MKKPDIKLYLCEIKEVADQYLSRCWTDRIRVFIIARKNVKKRCFCGTVVLVESDPNYLAYLERIGSGGKVCCWFRTKEDRNLFKEYLLSLLPKDSVDFKEFVTENYYLVNNMPGIEFSYRQQPHEE